MTFTDAIRTIRMLVDLLIRVATLVEAVRRVARSLGWSQASVRRLWRASGLRVRQVRAASNVAALALSGAKTAWASL